MEDVCRDRRLVELAGMTSPPPKRERLGSLSMTTSQSKPLGITQGAALGQAPPKKLTIKHSKQASQPASENNEFQSTALATFTRSIRAITAVPPVPTPESLSTLYSLCEGCVPVAASSTGIAEVLYDRIRLELERKVSGIKQSLTHSINIRSSEADSTDDAAQLFLITLHDEWNAFARQLSLIRSIFTPLDRTYVLQRKDLLGIWDLGLNIFRIKIAEDHFIGAQTTKGLLSYIQRQRCPSSSTTTDSPLSVFLNVLTLLSSLSTSTYHDLFLDVFLTSSKTFYASQAESMLLQHTQGFCSIGTYLQHVQSRLNEEAHRAELIHSSVGGDAAALKSQMLRIVESQLVAKQTHRILLRLDDVIEDLEDAERLYALLSRVSEVPALQKSLRNLIEKQGFEAIKDPARDETMVDALLAFKKKTDQLFHRPFKRDPSIGFAIRDAFESFINKRQNKPAEMLAKYIDNKMRLGNKAMSEDEMEDIFDQVLYLFNFTQAKDLFEAFYTRLFAKRLLLNKSASSDMEKTMLLKLQRACGAAFTSKLEIMAKDMDLSNDLMSAYREHRSNTGSVDPFELSVNVLTTGNWPSFTPSQPILPREMITALERFKHFYSIKHTGRQLAWQHSLDQCTLKARFPKGKKELNVSLFQSLVLMLFDHVAPGEQLSYQSIIDQTGLDAKEAARTLQSLACGRTRVLSKTPKGKDVNPGDTFCINEDFTDPKMRIKINQIQSKETVEEAKSTTDRVFVDRQNHVQLVIVRTLKSRKTIKHQELVMEVVSQLKTRFKVETTEIKKAISSLIERDYMERSEEGKDVYNYVA